MASRCEQQACAACSTLQIIACQQRQPEYRDYSSNTWHASVCRRRPRLGQVLGISFFMMGQIKVVYSNCKDLGGSDHDTDREWHARTMRYAEGWALTQPGTSRSGRSRPIQTLKNGHFMPQHSGSGEEWTHSSPSSSQWQPRLRTEKYFSKRSG